MLIQHKLETVMRTAHQKKVILLLQGPTWTFFRDLHNELTKQGHVVLRINLGPIDWFHWIGKKSFNYHGRFKNWPIFLEKFLISHKVNDVVYHQDLFPYHKVAVQVANKLGITASSCECGYLRPDWITFEKNGMSNELSQFPRDPDIIKEKAAQLPSVGRDIIYPYTFFQIAWHEVSFDLTNVFLFFLFPWFSQNRYYHPIIEYLSIIPRLFVEKKNKKRSDMIISQLIKSKTKYYLFPLQLQSDYQIQCNSPFKHIGEAMRRTIISFANHAPSDAQLVFKVHPYDYGLEPWGKLVNRYSAEFGVIGRTHLVDGGNLPRMISNSLGMITINSTCGIHALRAGSPTKVLANPIYDIPGLTFQGPLDEFWQSKEKPSRKLFDAFEKLLAVTIQVRGNFHTKKGKKAAARTIAKRIIEDKINTIYY